MPTTFSHDTFISPFTWRYGTEEMRGIFSEVHKRQLLRDIWIAIAESQSEAGLVTAEQVADLKAHRTEVDIERATEIEDVIRHDLMAEIKTYAEQCPVGGKIIHLGATSMDILDNMDVIRQKEAMDIIIAKLSDLLSAFATRIEAEADTPCMAFTHIQPAEVTTVGYRLAQVAQDLLDDYEDIVALRNRLKGKGIKGAVGTAASYAALLDGTGMSAREFEDKVMGRIGLVAFEGATQVYPRKQDYRIGTVLASLCATLYKFALDIRMLQTPPIGEWNEPFREKQVGSSAMPFKRNPINSEKIDSLCRATASSADTLWHNASSMILERTLDDSANRRVVLPELFLTCDEVLKTSQRLIDGLVFNTATIERNLGTYGLFAATERVLMELGRNGADRQEMHELIREHSLAAWPAVMRGEENPLLEMMASDEQMLSFLSREQIISLMDASGYTGDASERALNIAKSIRNS